MADDQSLPTDLTDRIAALPCGDRMKRALARVVDGVPYREAASAEGYADHRDVYRWAKRADLLNRHTRELVAGQRRLIQLTTAELERRLLEAPDSVTTKDLAVLMGICADKVSRYENWGRQEDSNDSAADRWGQLMDRLAVRGAMLTVSVEPAATALAALPAEHGEPLGEARREGL